MRRRAAAASAPRAAATRRGTTGVRPVQPVRVPEAPRGGSIGATDRELQRGQQQLLERERRAEEAALAAALAAGEIGRSEVEAAAYRAAHREAAAEIASEGARGRAPASPTKPPSPAKPSSPTKVPPTGGFGGAAVARGATPPSGDGARRLSASPGSGGRAPPSVEAIAGGPGC